MFCILLFIMLSVSFINVWHSVQDLLHMHDIVMLGVCKWQLTDWVGVNVPVYSVAIGERKKQVINNVNNLQSYQKCAWKTQCSIRLLSDFLAQCEIILFNVHVSCAVTLGVLSSYHCLAFCIAVSSFTYDIVMLWLWMTTYLLSRNKCTSSQCSNWGEKKTSDQHQQYVVISIEKSFLQQAAIRFPQLWNKVLQYAS